MKKNVLVIEDDAELASTMRDILEPYQYHVTLAHDCTEALQKSADPNLSLILLDIRMPSFSGFWFCEAFKKNPQTMHIPVVMVSALHSDEDVENAYDAGASGYLKKPFRAQELVETVANYLS